MQKQELELLTQLKSLLKRERWGNLADLLREVHPADIADLLENLDEAERVKLLSLFDVGMAAEIMEEVEPYDRSALMRDLELPRAAEILDQMANDNVADVLGDLAPHEVVDLLGLMEKGEAADVQELLEYLEDTAGGIMTTEVVALEETLTAERAIEALRQMAPDAETVYYVYIINHSAELRGVLSLRELIIAPTDTPLRDIMQTNVITVSPEEDQEEVARVVAKYDLLAVPVVNAENELLGIVTIDDILDVIEDEATEDIYRLGGAPLEEAETERLTPWQRARSRLPWLLIVLAAELVAASVIQGFTGALEAMVALAYFVPVLTGMGGNVGTQSLAVTVRGLGTGDLGARDLGHALLQELYVGLMLGLGAGGIGFITAFLWQQNVVIGLIVGAAMLFNMLAAAVIGTLVPFLLSSQNIDPAVASGPFVTTFLDIVGLLNYFLIATLLLRAFGYDVF